MKKPIAAEPVCHCADWQFGLAKIALIEIQIKIKIHFYFHFYHFSNADTKYTPENSFPKRQIQTYIFRLCMRHLFSFKCLSSRFPSRLKQQFGNLRLPRLHIVQSAVLFHHTDNIYFHFMHAPNKTAPIAVILIRDNPNFCSIVCRWHCYCHRHSFIHLNEYLNKKRFR